MFVRVDTRRRAHPPWATILIILVCVLVFLWLASATPDERLQLLRRWGTVPRALFDTSVPWLRQLIELQPLCLISSLFIHAEWMHLTGNLLFLMIFGLSAERTLGAYRFLTLFLVGGALANLVGALTLASANVPIIGSSGAVSAIVGAYVELFPRARLGLVLPLGLFLEFVRIPASLLIGFWIVLQLMFTYVGPAFGMVVWWTHIAGFAIGIALAWMSRGAIARRLRN